MKENKGLISAIAIVAVAIAISFFIKVNNENAAKDTEAKKTVDTKEVVDSKAEEKPEDNNSETLNKAEEETSNTKEDTEETKDASKVDNNDKKSENTTNQTEGEHKFYIESLVEYDKVMDSEKPIIIMFGTKVCPFCNEMRPFVSELSEEYKDKFELKYVDAEDYPDIAYKYPIRGVPAFMYKNADKTGYTPSPIIAEHMKKANELSAFSETKEKTHDFTMSYGFMEKSFLKDIIEEMLANVK